MKRIRKAVLLLAGFVLLTILTQVGGLILLGCLGLFEWVNRTVYSRGTRVLLKASIFLAVYLLLSSTLVPLLARQFGRVPLPVLGSSHLKPLNLLTCLLNRHYVRPELKSSVENVAARFAKTHPEAVLYYLDANFPFLNGFPLLPHLSHQDGRKVDLAFRYREVGSGNEINRAPSWIGYGICEEPTVHEVNTANNCREKGYWQYSLLRVIVPQPATPMMRFDAAGTREMVRLFAQDRAVGKIFLEPHLKKRLRLSGYNKIRFHDCQAVRHDDHLHVQL